MGVGKDYKDICGFSGMRIGKLKLKNRLFLAPMVDVTDCAYRKICRDAGVGMAYTEMIYVDAILHKNDKTEGMMKKYRGEKPVGLQITGRDVEDFEKFVKSAKWKKFDLIDLNCGCPSVRIVGSKAGSYLLEDPKNVGEIVRILKKTGKPVSVKVRLGMRSVNVLDVAREVEKAGADALTVHARLAVDGNNVPAKWDWIGKVKKAVKIPVIGNGDVFCGEDAFEMLRICDGVMVGRGAIGDPLIFRRVLDYLGKGKIVKSGKGKVVKSRISAGGLKGDKVERGDDLKGNLKLFLEYLDLAERYGVLDLGRVKYIGSKFFRGFAGSRGARMRFGKLKNVMEVRGFVKELL